MDWQSSMGRCGLENKPPHEEEGDHEEEEDFYGYNSLPANATHPVDGDGEHAVMGASSNQVRPLVLIQESQLTQYAKQIHTAVPNKNQNHNPAMAIQKTIETQARATPTPKQVKAENQRKAELLREKLMAKKQNTPVKTLSRPDTPSKSVAAPLPVKSEIDKSEKPAEPSEPSSDAFGLEALLAEGQAAAEAKMKQVAETKAQQTAPTSNKDPVQSKENGVDSKANKPTTQPTANKPQDSPEEPKWSTKLTDAYYADLSVWLEVTGYHDVEYRESKLRTYKERKSLEQEAARIQERLEKLRQDEQATMTSLRATPVHFTTNTRPAPTMPVVMPNPDTFQTPSPSDNQNATAPTTNGIKRAHSPEPVHSEKSTHRDRSNGYRIRGANESPGSRPTTARPPRSPSPNGLASRVSYAGARRGSLDDYNRGPLRRPEERDLSLERRMGYYAPGGSPPGATAYPPPSRDNRYDPPRENGRGYENRGRFGYSNVNVAPSPPRSQEYQHYRGSGGLDLKKGGQSSRFRRP